MSWVKIYIGMFYNSCFCFLIFSSSLHLVWYTLLSRNLTWVKISTENDPIDAICISIEPNEPQNIHTAVQKTRWVSHTHRQLELFVGSHWTCFDRICFHLLFNCYIYFVSAVGCCIQSSSSAFVFHHFVLLFLASQQM